MSMTNTKEYLKMLYKNENIDLVAFFSGLLFLAVSNPDLLDISTWDNLLTIFVKIGLIISFGTILTRICLRTHRTIVLYWNETKYKNEIKDFTISESITAQEVILTTASEVGSAIATKIESKPETQSPAQTPYDSEGNLIHET